MENNNSSNNFLKFKRLDKQITLNEIPESYRDNVTLVVQPQEEKQAKKIHKNIFVLDSNNIGYAKTIKQATYEWSINRNKHFFLFDDDLQFLLYKNPKVLLFKW